MEDKKDEKMTEKRDVAFIELSWNDQEDLLSLADSEQFKDVILKESYKSIKVIQEFIEREEYEKCGRIQKIINKYKL